MRARVLYEVVTHGDMGRPRARNVQDSSLLDSFSTAWGAARPSGTMYKDLRNYGFIKADSGEKYMFVMPLSCSWFGDGFPPLGTEVLYDVVKDGKAGKLRAESVQAIMPAAPATSASAERRTCQADPPIRDHRHGLAPEDSSQLRNWHGLSLQGSGHMQFFSKDLL